MSEFGLQCLVLVQCERNGGYLPVKEMWNELQKGDQDKGWKGDPIERAQDAQKCENGRGKDLGAVLVDVNNGRCTWNGGKANLVFLDPPNQDKTPQYNDGLYGIRKGMILVCPCDIG